ncbi:S8 family serine peptidase [Marinospirillum celere]|uniref:S8 family serine peptidase n=1 Tax=Marinospirillum celere TaxID=1122252 RepID=UPI0015A6270C|nr:S8 family serine peptidase [Marinospirillum celere]
MKRLIFIVFVIWAVSSGSAAAQNLLVAWTPLENVQWTLELVATDAQPAAQVEGTLVTTSESRNYKLLSYPVPDRQQRLELIKRLQAKDEVLFVERDQPVETQSSIPEYFLDLGLNDFSLAPTDCSLAPIAIIDTGVDSAHPDLNRQSLEFRPDINIIESTTSSQDDDGHGTHIAGLIAGTINEQQKTAGLCDQAVILSIKSLDGRGTGSTTSLVQGIEAALDAGVKIINASLVTGDSPSLRFTIEDANQEGVLVVAAAGNNGRSLDIQPAYPASYTRDLPLVLAIANANSNRKLNLDSNYGLRTVDLAAPGTSLKSTWLNQEYRFLTGTSMATPLVAATLAALATQEPSLPPEALKAIVLNSLEHEEALLGELRYPGILDVRQALTGSLDELARATWFNYQLNELDREISLSGYLLDEVDQVEYQYFDEALTLQSLDANLQAGNLSLDLPGALRRGQLLMQTASGRELQPIPINLAPQPLANLKVAWEGENILLTWEPSKQPEKVEIQRRSSASTNWEVIAEVDPQSGEYLDEQVEIDQLDFRVRTSYIARETATSDLQTYVSEWQELSLDHPERLEGVPLQMPGIAVNQPFQLDLKSLANYWGLWEIEDQASNFVTLTDGLLIIEADQPVAPYRLDLRMERGSEDGDQRIQQYRFQVVESLSETREIIWEGLRVRVTREEGDGQAWWVYPVYATRNGQTYESISILTEDEAALEGIWTFEFFGHSGINLNGFSARQDKALDSWEPVNLDFLGTTSAQWILTSSDTQLWSRPAGEKRQLLINPSVTLRSSSVQVDCYIASSLYGAQSGQVEVLRDFRNKALATHPPGRWLIRQYYRYSPAIAEWMDDKPRLEAVTRWWLDRLVAFWSWFK